MSKKPKGAIGSPYVNETEDSLGKMLGDAFDRLHENSWDGGKAAKKKREEKRIAKVNKDIQEKIKKSKVKIDENEMEIKGENIEIKESKTNSNSSVKEVTSSDASIEQIETFKKDAKIIEEIIKSPNKFTSELKKELMSMLIDNNADINEVSDEKIIFTQNNEKFVMLPLKEN